MVAGLVWVGSVQRAKEATRCAFSWEQRPLAEHAFAETRQGVRTTMGNCVSDYAAILKQCHLCYIQVTEWPTVGKQRFRSRGSPLIIWKPVHVRPPHSNDVEGRTLRRDRRTAMHSPRAPPS